MSLFKRYSHARHAKWIITVWRRSLSVVSRELYHDPFAGLMVSVFPFKGSSLPLGGWSLMRLGSL